MKKLLTAILSASIIAVSLAVPVSANYTEPETSYDIIAVNETFDSGTATNTIDNTSALKTGASFTEVFSTSIDTTKEFYLGFDFCFDSADGTIEIRNRANSNNTGPIITISDVDQSGVGQLRTQTASEKYQALGEVKTGIWYSGEIEGRTGAGQKYTTFRLYKYVGGVKTLVQETDANGFNMRNLSSNSRVFEYMQANNVSIDNVLLVEEKPDTIALTSTATEINAGGDVALDYTMTRLGTEMTKYSVTWSVYNEENTALLEGENIKINQSGILTANIDSETQTVTVRATAAFGDKELYGSKQIKINAVDTSNEKFDTIIVSGAPSMKAGTSETYTFTAKKNGTDVTDTLTDGDVVWGIYNNLGVTKNNNVNMKVEDGVLTVDASVIQQDITVRASSASGAVNGSAPVSITWADSQKEIVLSYDACETDKTGTTLTDSWDGSKAYAATADISYSFGTQSAYAITDVDIKFGDGDGHGLTLYDIGNENSNLRVHNGGLGQQTSGSKWDTIIQAEDYDKDAWYHIEFLYLGGSESGYNIYKYNDDSTKTLVKTVLDCNRRNDKAYGKITFSTGLVIDNFKVALAIPNEVKVTAPGQYVFAGDTAQFTATASRNGLTFAGASGITWTVCDGEGLPILEDWISISDAGLLNVDATATPQTVTVRAATASSAKAEAAITIQASEIFTMTNIGINEAGNKIVRLYVEKNFYYNDDVVFILTIYKDNRLIAVRTLKTFGERLNEGSNELTIDLDLPSDFDPSVYSVHGMVWSGF